jgi:hypothetical protein
MLAITTGGSKGKIYRVTVRPRDVAAPAIHARVCANSSPESFGSSLNRAMIKAPTMAAQLPIAARRFSASVNNAGIGWPGVLLNPEAAAWSNRRNVEGQSRMNSHRYARGKLQCYNNQCINCA